jgi:hypothetical protein
VFPKYSGATKGYVYPKGKVTTELTEHTEKLRFPLFELQFRSLKNKLCVLRVLCGSLPHTRLISRRRRQVGYKGTELYCGRLIDLMSCGAGQL